MTVREITRAGLVITLVISQLVISPAFAEWHRVMQQLSALSLSGNTLPI
jgi:hypothetical protein